MSNSFEEIVDCGSNPCALPVIAEQPQYRPNVWQVSFVQDCNLRCGYCSTAFGRCGANPAVMQPELWAPLCEMVAQMSRGVSHVRLEFGTGETFLHFDGAMRFLDCFRCCTDALGIEVDPIVVTNGTTATAEQLQICLEKKISLCFSIDGPRISHDAFRKFPGGRPTHQIALKNWRHYRQLVAGMVRPRCTTSSTVAGRTRLIDVAQFWREHGVERFRTSIVEPSRHLGSPAFDDLEHWRRQYLKDLESIALGEAKRLQGRDFEAEYRGPHEIVDAWRRLKRGASYGNCAAGISTIAVDAGGRLYPCQAFIGFPEFSIGNIHSGLHSGNLASFREQQLRARAVCNGCWARFLCSGGCSAAAPHSGVLLDVPGGCEFSRARVEIAVRSYLYWCGGASGNGDHAK
jgi:uncharacterized protein